MPAALVDGYETVVGLEVHVQLLTAHKLFSPARVRVGQPANVDLDAVDAGLPGALPVLNREAVRCAIRLGLAVNSTIDVASQFARKHYFYPDSPKGYQTSQHDRPVLSGGAVDVIVDDKTGETRRVQLVRAHLEEDAGKSLHGEHEAVTRLDFNRAGTALLEVVTTPSMSSGEEAMRFFRALRGIVMALGICDGNLQEGSMRADANVSVRRPGEPLGTRVELKNINSPRFLMEAVEHEAARQRRLLRAGDVVVQETRLWDGEARQSRSLRSKEDSPDYRYLPDPDLPPLVISDAEIAAERATLPELPLDKRRRYVSSWGLPMAQAGTIVDDAAVAAAFEASCALAPGHEHAVANWVCNDVAALAIEGQTVSPVALARLVVLIESGAVAGKDAKALLRVLAETATTEAAAVDRLVDERGLRLQQGDVVVDAVRAIVAAVCSEYPTQVADVRAGKDKVKGFLVGQVLKRAGKGIDPKLAQQLVDAAIAGAST
jgi:aspartyl-tRNA(Asn)/glutamyl-tRNA(Gln) amidotransferase subunit B